MALVPHATAEPAPLRMAMAASPGGAEARRPAWLYTRALPPPDEAQRLADLRSFGILDAEPDPDCDRLVQLACLLCNVPMAAITLVDAQRQWYRARVGVPVPEVPRHRSFCAHAILAPDELLEIADTARLPWAEAQPWGPQGPSLGFYAGAPLRTREGSAIGTLCVMDHVARTLTAAQKDGLAQLAQAVTSHLLLRRQLRAATETDRLTGLPNWFAFETAFDRSQARCGMVCFVRLKTINQITSAHGFRIADNLIRQTAARLRAHADAGASVGRIKRGLFVLFFPDAEPADFARRGAPALAASLNAPYDVNHLSLVCPVNLGFAAYPDDGRTLDEVVSAADAALQVAIEREQPMAFFDRSVDNVQSKHYRLEPQLRRALERSEFVNYYQPKVELGTGRILGVEALVRWLDPARGLVPPNEFVPALETTGLIGEVAQRIMERAIADWRSWRDAGLPAPRIAVNVAASQLRNDDFLPSLQRALAAVGGDPSGLGIEVTESILISNMERAIEVLQQVRALGLPVAIDDFGTGYSSLAYIVTLPIDELKIDRAFVRKITSDPAYEGIVRTCVSLARGLHLKVVAEGVETEAQALCLERLGCDQAQGFLYSPPVPAEALVRMLQAGAIAMDEHGTASQG